MSTDVMTVGVEHGERGLRIVLNLPSCTRDYAGTKKGRADAIEDVKLFLTRELQRAASDGSDE
ncbi:MAG: hypothetical protein ACF8XB_12180 [Planctomycetota bacterium JB042]